MKKFNLLINTLKYLKGKQIYYRLYYFIKCKFFNKNYNKLLSKEIQPLNWKEHFLYKNSFSEKNIFDFLNLKHEFKGEINWNYSKYGKLWTFNLNYFDFLNQEVIKEDLGLMLIKDYIEKNNTLIEGKESYTISLRGINWIKFLSKNRISNREINQALYNDYQRLYSNLEYQHLGNHLLENAYSLLFGAYYFQDEKLYKKAKKVLVEELNEQTLNDGAHFELSPMYHQILLHRALDCYNLVKSNLWKNNELNLFIKDKVLKMLGWLATVTYKNGNIPMVNDSAYNIAPSSSQLFDYAKDIGLSWHESKLLDSGYRKVVNENYELFIDVGQVGPSYQSAHVHSDTFNFELYAGQSPIIVDLGTSTYEKNSLRQKQRSTESHNTVKIGNFEQSDIWSGFRVAERAKIVNFKKEGNIFEATHDGYKKLKILHTRKFECNKNNIVIQDALSKNFEKKNSTRAYLHFHPSIKKIKIDANKIELVNENIIIEFSKETYKIDILEYDFAYGFNKTLKAKKLEIYFNIFLETQIHL